MSQEPTQPASPKILTVIARDDEDKVLLRIAVYRDGPRLEIPMTPGIEIMIHPTLQLICSSLDLLGYKAP